MDKLKNKGLAQFKSSYLKRSNLMHNYYAVNSIDGLKQLPQVTKLNGYAVCMNWLGKMSMFINIILSFQYTYEKHLSNKTKSVMRK